MNGIHEDRSLASGFCVLVARLRSEMVADPRISSVFGCWTSASRKAVKPVFEAANKLLW